MKVTKTEFVAEVAKKADITKKEAAECVNVMLDVIKENVKEGNSVQFIGFGKFEAADRKARQGRNPQTGAAMEIPAHKAIVFHAGKAFKESVK